MVSIRYARPVLVGVAAFRHIEGLADLTHVVLEHDRHQDLTERLLVGRDSFTGRRDSRDCAAALLALLHLSHGLVGWFRINEPAVEAIERHDDGQSAAVVEARDLRHGQ